MRVVGMWMVVALFAPIAAADLIGAQGGLTGNLVAISPVDGSTTVLGPHGTLLFYAGLDVRRSDGQMFGLSAGSEPIARPAGLYRIDPWTATSTLVGTIQSPSNDFLFEGGFAISPDGVGYGLYYTTTFAPGNPFSLIRIDLDTAAFSVVGAVTPVGINGLVFRSDGKLIGWDDETDTLVEIDTATGATTTIGPLGFDARFVGGLTVLNGTGYLVEGGDDASSLYTVNLYTGATSFVAHVSDPGFGITALTSAAPIPEPSTLLLVAAALTLAVARRRRR